MKKQRGFYNFDLGGAMLWIAIVSVIAGIAIDKFATWAWPYIKAAILWSLT